MQLPEDDRDFRKMKCVVGHMASPPLSAEEMKVLFDEIIRLGKTEIEYIFLGAREGKFGDEGAKRIAEAMAAGALPKLLCIEVTGNDIGDEGFAAVAGSIKHCPSFRDLIFKENRVGDAGFAALTEVMRRNEWRNIERLNVAGAQFARHTISEASFLPFAQGLADGAIKAVRLEELEMSDNDIGDEGFGALALAVKRGNLRKLKSLYMVANHITDEGAYVLADAIRLNKRTALYDLRLGFQNIRDVDAPRVTKEGGAKALEDAGAEGGRRVYVQLTPLGV